jgi:hypothetical protein
MKIKNRSALECSTYLKIYKEYLSENDLKDDSDDINIKELYNFIEEIDASQLNQLYDKLYKKLK